MNIKEINLIWLQGQGCTGCTVSLTGATHPSLIDVLSGFLPPVTGIILKYHPTIMLPHGEKALENLKAAVKGELDPFILILEGAIPDEGKAAKSNGFWCMIGEEEGKLMTFNDWVSRLSEKAVAVVAVGTCASYGGIPHGEPNPTGAKGAFQFFGKSWKSRAGLPVICVPGCPAQGDHIIESLAYLILSIRGFLPPPALDEYNRPLFLFEKKAHENCPRAGLFAEGKFSKNFGEPYCMGLLGCKGLIAHCNIPRKGFVEGVGGCPTIGSICIGCTEPEFPDGPFSPFFKKAPASVYTIEAFHDIKGKFYALLHRLKKREI